MRVEHLTFSVKPVTINYRFGAKLNHCFDGETVWHYFYKRTDCQAHFLSGKRQRSVCLDQWSMRVFFLSLIEPPFIA